MIERDLAQTPVAFIQMLTLLKELLAEIGLLHALGVTL